MPLTRLHGIVLDACSVADGVGNLTGGFDVVKGEKVKIKGYLEEFALSKNEADELIMTAREKIYKD